MRNSYVAFLVLAFSGAATCQEMPRTEPAQSRHLLGIIPNYKTFPTLDRYEPLTNREKFKIAYEHSLDRGTFVLAGLFGGLGQLTNTNKSFAQGPGAFGRYFGTSYGDLVIGNYMSEAVYPSILHQDPRYFRRGTGSGPARFTYALSRVFWTRRDTGGSQFNYSEWLGNSTAVAISNAYYPDHRSAGDAMSKLAMQVGVDAIGNVLKEFWPDLQRRFRKKSQGQPAAGAR